MATTSKFQLRPYSKIDTSKSGRKNDSDFSDKSLCPAKSERELQRRSWARVKRRTSVQHSMTDISKPVPKTTLVSLWRFCMGRFLQQHPEQEHLSRRNDSKARLRRRESISSSCTSVNRRLPSLSRPSSTDTSSCKPSSVFEDAEENRIRAYSGNGDDDDEEEEEEKGGKEENSTMHSWISKESESFIAAEFTTLNLGTGFPSAEAKEDRGKLVKEETKDKGTTDAAVVAVEDHGGIGNSDDDADKEISDTAAKDTYEGIIIGDLINYSENDFKQIENTGEEEEKKDDKEEEVTVAKSPINSNNESDGYKEDHYNIDDEIKFEKYKLESNWREQNHYLKPQTGSVIISGDFDSSFYNSPTWMHIETKTPSDTVDKLGAKRIQMRSWMHCVETQPALLLGKLDGFSHKYGKICPGQDPTSLRVTEVNPY